MRIRRLADLSEVGELVCNSKRHGTELVLFLNAISGMNLIIARKEAPGDKDVNASAKDVCHDCQWSPGIDLLGQGALRKTELPAEILGYPC
jgi:hypothetical protein